MQFSQKDLIKICEKASTINERLSADFVPDEDRDNDAIINARLDKWCQVTAQGNWKKFEQRLAWEGLDVSTVRCALGSVTMSDQQQLPSWAETLNECLKFSSLIDLNALGKAAFQKNRFLDPQQLLPFEDVLLPFIYVAQHKLRNQAGHHYDLLSDVAHANLERNLLEQLSELCSLSFELEFSVFRATRQSTLINILRLSGNDHSRWHYQTFIKGLLEGGLLTFFSEYPVLARLVGTVIDLWVDATREFLMRLGTDWSEINRTFQAANKLGQVVSIKTGLSDRHNNGRSVMEVTFASGLKLIYKPKDLYLEQAYFKLLAWLNQQGLPLEFKLLNVLNRSTYGWVEFVDTLPCKDEEEIRRYYQRAGTMLCLVYILCGTDLHAGNIIACGEHPVLIDLETLMYPRVQDVQNMGNLESAQYLANQQLLISSLRTGLLPSWWFGPGEQAYHVGGLRGFIEQNSLSPVLKLHNFNTDSMVLGYEKNSIQLQVNAITRDGIDVALKDCFGEIVNGFSQMYHFMMKHRKAILAIDSPLMDLNHQLVRFIFRTTRTYVLILKTTLKPEFLRDGAERSIQLDILSRGMLLSDEKPLSWALLSREQQALEKMDIPLFAARSDSDALAITPNHILKNYFSEPCFYSVVSRLRQLSERDLKQQLDYIWGAWYAYTATDVHLYTKSKNFNIDLNEITSLTPEKIVQQAIAIAGELQKQAIYSTDGSVTWIAPQYYLKQQRFQFQTMGYNLYDGSCGVACFLAALEKVTDGAGFRNLALGALQSLVKNVQKPGYKRIFEAMGIGASAGYSSFIYGMVRVSQFINEPILLEEAQKIASLITPNLIAADQAFDIMSGAAGAILALLCLYSSSADQEVLDQAIDCGHHLLNHRVVSNSGHRAWSTIKGKILTGFSHGAAGIAYALLRLYQATSEAAFLEAASEAIAYEQSVFIPEVSNWPDLRKSSTKDSPTCMCSWCHGAPGIGLARVAGLDILDIDEIRQEIEVAIETTKQHGLSNTDHLCCGNLGRVEFLFTAARKLNQTQLLEIAMAQAAQVVAYAEQRGTFNYNPSLGYTPGLFQGVAGIGYELLRLSYPDVLPSILLFD